jgi:hypothetical protein
MIRVGTVLINNDSPTDPKQIITLMPPQGVLPPAGMISQGRMVTYETSPLYEPDRNIS